jgi:hypothetical protein
MSRERLPADPRSGTARRCRLLLAAGMLAAAAGGCLLDDSCDGPGILGSEASVATPFGAQGGVVVESCDDGVTEGRHLRGSGGQWYRDSAPGSSDRADALGAFLEEQIRPALMPFDAAWGTGWGLSCRSTAPGPVALVLLSDWREMDGVLAALRGRLEAAGLAEEISIEVSSVPCPQ